MSSAARDEGRDALVDIGGAPPAHVGDIARVLRGILHAEEEVLPGRHALHFLPVRDLKHPIARQHLLDVIEPGDDRVAFGDEHGFDPAQDPEDEIEVGEEPSEYAFL
ncbi:MAG: hypothetical protein M3495_14440 [Pseudomonadota bacterium]|nr:hypothetical protein [Gammaproteobacteria bacterium]MDQ3582720.1 hypothetical protein [Pseudomonadota bacterium]